MSERRNSQRKRWPYLGLLCLALASSGGRAQVTVLPDDNAPEPTAERHVIAEGETLSTLAERYLGDPDAWPRLWSFNPEITNPHWIYPGLTVRLKQGVDLSGPNAATAVAAGAAKSISGLRFARRIPPATGTIRLGEEAYLDRDALAHAARIVGSKHDHYMLSPSDEVYLRFAKGAAEPTEGKELTVFIRHHRPELSPKAGKLRIYYAHEVGEVVRVLGGLKVLSYDRAKQVAKAVITEASEPIERGFEVADVPLRLAQVAPKANAREVAGKIVLASRPLGTLGDGQVVFVDIGAKRGVEVGNRLLVVRQGDTWREQLSLREDLTGALRPDNEPARREDLPVEVVGELRVLYVRPDSATALITRSTVELVPGDQVQMRAGE